MKSPGMTVADALRAAGIAALDARVLLRTVLRATDAVLAAHPDRVLTDSERADFLRRVERRRAGEPVAYLVGEREFYGRPFRVTPAVLIPRPETEVLVELAIERIPADRPARVLDLGTGSGCIAVTIACERPRAVVLAIDQSDDALAIARDNAAQLDASNVTFRAGDWLHGLTEEFDVIVANPPYVAAGDPHLGAGDLRHEPASALASGADGLAAIRAIAAAAPGHLAPGGWLLLEHGYDQAARCHELLAAAGLADVSSHRDLSGIARVTVARRP